MEPRSADLRSTMFMLTATLLVFGSAMLAAPSSEAQEPYCDIGASFNKKCSVAGGPWQDSCEIHAGEEVTYIYLVEVYPPAATFEVWDDKLGVIGQSSGGALSRTVTLTETTTNQASMSPVQVDPGCYLIGYQCCDEVTVTVLPPTPAPTATPTPVSTCADFWPVSRVCTVGKGQSASNNAKLSHCITGNIVNPSAVRPDAHRIPVCRGTWVDAMVTDMTGTPSNTPTGSLSCDTAGCSGIVNADETYKSISQDGQDRDRITLIPN